MSDKTHHFILESPALVPEEGFLLGNGDVSVSCYQGIDCLRFRLGKGDVWDRRIDFSKDPKPTHIAEVERGILEEGWSCGPYGGPVTALKGSTDPERMREICQGCPPSYTDSPFPCPKPVGEFAIHVSGDRQGLRVTQHLFVEEGRIVIVCEWNDAPSLSVEVVVHPERNQIAVKWAWETDLGSAAYGGFFEGIPDALPLWISLSRNADPSIADFASAHAASSRLKLLEPYAKSDSTPLPPPQILGKEGRPVLVQELPFGGAAFRCAAALAGSDLGIESTCTRERAFIHALPKREALSGEFCVAVETETSADSEVIVAWIDGVMSAASGAFSEIAEDAKSAASRFWKMSKLELAEKSLEDLWYSSLHIKRSVLRAGKCAPGLFLPSTVRDYSLWHGDYHTNYNFQSIFLGDYVANHPETGDAFFDAMEWFLEMGRHIARDFYGCRGAFIQLSGYPLSLDQDPLGTVPMGRMAYMTGWVAAQYFSRWLHFRDLKWLESRGYPAVRELALFYTDFLKLGPDGLYHAFPSNQGEDGFTGEIKPYRDRAQILRHARSCMMAAVEMAGELRVDTNLVSDWTTRLAQLAPEEGDPSRQQTVISSNEFARLSPEFLGFDGAMPPRDADSPPAFLSKGHDFYDWYPGKLPYEWTTHLRNQAWNGERDLPRVAELLRRWTHSNGMLWAMSLSNYGRVGGWTESLGIIAAIQDLLLQSWAGFIEVFPGWPASQNAKFDTLRAEGAFLISAEIKEGVVTFVRIASEIGGTCRLRLPWPGREPSFSILPGNESCPFVLEGVVVSFQMDQDQTIELVPAPQHPNAL